MGYIETNTSWDYVGMRVYPLDENGQRITYTAYVGGQETQLDVSYYLPDMGLYRVSNSNRYNDILVPTLKHTTVEVPGGDGMYWFGSQHTQKPFTVKFAYDSLKEEDLHDLRKIFRGKNRLHIVFDEYPYKYYDVVVSQAPQFDYVPYTEDRVIDGVVTPRRIFKGEGSVQFTSYLPYACGLPSVKGWDDPAFKYYDETTETYKPLPNIEELKGTVNYFDENASGSYNLDTYIPINGCFYLWNAGDIPTDFLLTLGATLASNITRIDLHREDPNEGSVFIQTLFQKSSNAPTFEKAITFDTRLHLIYDDQGKFYNQYFPVENFRQIPVGGVYGIYLIGTDTYGSASINYQYKFY